MEIKLAKKIQGIRSSTKSVDAQSLFLKPKRFRKKAIKTPSQRRMKFIAYSPPGFFKDLILKRRNQMQKTYGNIPLWIEYVPTLSSISWNLCSVQAAHNLLIYGEKLLVEEFLSGFTENVENDLSNRYGNTATVVDSASSKPSLKIENRSESTSLPLALQKATDTKNSKSGIMAASGTIASIAGIILALSFMNKHRSQNLNRQKDRKEALDAAMSSVSRITTTKPVLRTEKFNGRKWTFVISDYIVSVNKRGLVEEIKKVKKPE